MRFRIPVNEEERIRAAVEERKQRARSLGIVKTVFRLYRDHLRFLGADLRRDAERLPKGMSAVRLPRAEGAPECVSVSLESQSFLFSWELRPVYLAEDDTRYASLGLRIGEETVLQIACVHREDRYGEGDWRISEYSDVEAFREGPWVEQINRLASRVSSRDGQLRAEAAKLAKRREVEDLKRKFGL